MEKLKRNRDYGQSLLELIIALGVFVVGVATIGFLVLDANVASRQGLERAQATLLAKGGLEEARALRDSGFDNLSNMLDTYDQFTRNVVVSGAPGILDDDSDIRKIESEVTWPITPTRQGSINLVSYLTDWNQTQGDAKNLSVNISGAALSSGSKVLDGITIENISIVPGDNIVISRMTLWWNLPDTIHRIRIDTTNVFSLPPPSGEPSGTEINIADFTVGQGSGAHNIEFRFNGSMVGTDFIIKFIMSDGSTKYVLVDL